MRSKHSGLGYTQIEVILVLALAAFSAAAVGYGYTEFRRQQTVTSAVDLVGAVQASAAEFDATLPVKAAAIAEAVAPQFRSKAPPALAGLHGGGTAYTQERALGGYEIVLEGIDPDACAGLVTRVWPMVDGIAAGSLAGKRSVALKRAELGEGQAMPTAALMRSACESEEGSSTVVLAMASGFPPAPSGPVKPADPIKDDPIELPPPDGKR